jgi:hypothetical protein
VPVLQVDLLSLFDYYCTADAQNVPSFRLWRFEMKIGRLQLEWIPSLHSMTVFQNLVGNVGHKDIQFGPSKANEELRRTVSVLFLRFTYVAGTL